MVNGVGCLELSNGYFGVRARWGLISQDVSANTSKIFLEIYADARYGYELDFGTLSGYVVLNGVTYNFRKYVGRIAPPLTEFAVQVLYNDDITIPHNLDGSKTFNVDFACYTWGDKNSDCTLPQLPQATQITTFPNFTVGDVINITLDRKSTNYTNKLELKIGNTSIKTITDITTSTAITLNSTEQSIIYNALPNAITATVVLYCTTYNGINQVGSTISKNATATIPSSIIPSFTSLSHAEINTNVKTIIGAYVKTLSNIRFSIVDAIGGYGSTIKSYKINYNGVDYNTANIDTGLINWSGDKVITATITDSRDRTAIKTITINALDYSSPKIDIFKAERCNSDGTINALGTYAKVVRSGVISNLNSKNQVVVDIYSRLKGSTSWGVVKNTVTEIVGKTTYSASPVLNPYIVTSSYEFRLDVKDKFNTTTSYFTLSTGQVVMSWGRTGLGVGKIHEQGALDVEGDVYVSGKLGYVIPKATGTGTNINLSNISLIDGFTTSFIINANNNASITTINGKRLYKENTTTTPKLVAGKTATVRYSSVGDCFFLKASAEGTAVPSHVLAGKTFSNDDDIGLIGTIPSKTAETIIPSTTDKIIPAGRYLSGAQTIKGDANLVASKLPSDLLLFGVQGTRSLGKKFVSGTTTSSGFSQYYLTSGTTMGFGTLVVSGLTFKPSIVLILENSGSTMLWTMYLGNSLTGFPTNVALLHRYSSNAMGSEPQYKIDASRAPVSVTASGFTLPVNNVNNGTQIWIAFE